MRLFHKELNIPHCHFEERLTYLLLFSNTLLTKTENKFLLKRIGNQNAVMRERERTLYLKRTKVKKKKKLLKQPSWPCGLDFTKWTWMHRDSQISAVRYRAVCKSQPGSCLPAGSEEWQRPSFVSLTWSQLFSPPHSFTSSFIFLSFPLIVFLGFLPLSSLGCRFVGRILSLSLVSAGIVWEKSLNWDEQRRLSYTETVAAVDSTEDKEAVGV